MRCGYDDSDDDKDDENDDIDDDDDVGLSLKSYLSSSSRFHKLIKRMRFSRC